MSSRLIIAVADISNFLVLAKRFRGKTAKQLYWCGKSILLTGSVDKPLGFAVAQVPAELTKSVIYTALGQIGESIIGYVSGIGFVRYLYKVRQPSKLKAIARLAYNIVCLPVTLYSKGIGSAFDLLKISKLEEMWFGQPVYIFDDNRVWIEKNFTLSDVFETMEEDN